MNADVYNLIRVDSLDTTTRLPGPQDGTGGPSTPSRIGPTQRPASVRTNRSIIESTTPTCKLSNLHTLIAAD